MVGAELGQVDQLVGLSDSVSSSLGLGCQGGDQVQCRVLALPVGGVSIVLLQHGVDVGAEDVGDPLLKMSSQTLDKITRSSPPGVNITSLQISSDELFRIIFKHLHVTLPHLHVGHDDLLADAAQHIVVLEQVLIVRSVGHTGQELDGVGDEEVVLGLGSSGEEQVPDRGDELRHERLELLLVLESIESNVVADLTAQLLQHPGLIIISGEERVGESEKIMKPRHPGGHVILEELRQVLVVETVEDLGDVGEGTKDYFERIFVVGVLSGEVYCLSEEFCQRLGEVVQNKLDFFPQLL